MDKRIIRKRKRGFAAGLTALIMMVQFALTAGAYDWGIVWDTNEIGKAQLTGNAAGDNKVKTSVVEREDPTCTEPGSVKYVASVYTSGDVLIEENVGTHTYELDPLGHKWDKGSVVTPPTMTTAGLMMYICQRCEETKTERIPPLGAEVNEPEKPEKPDHGTMTAFYRVTVNHYQQNADGSYPDKPVETKVLYVAEGTVVSPDVNGYEGFISPEKQSVTVTAAAAVDYKYERASATITFDTDGGSEIEPITQLFGTSVTAPEDPTKDGVVFGGWTPAIPETMPAGDITIKAEWKVSDDADDADDDADGRGEDGDSIGYIIEVTPCEPGDEEFALIVEEAEKNGLEADKGFCWDIKLYRTINGVKDKQLHETAEPIEVTVELTEEQAERLASYSEFSIVRVHEGKTEVIECEFNREKRTLVFKSDRFSDYGLIHDTSLISDEEDGVSENPATGITFTGISFLTLFGAAVLASGKRRSR